MGNFSTKKVLVLVAHQEEKRIGFVADLGFLSGQPVDDVKDGLLVAPPSHRVNQRSVVQEPGDQVGHADTQWLEYDSGTEIVNLYRRNQCMLDELR